MQARDCFLSSATAKALELSTMGHWYHRAPSADAEQIHDYILEEETRYSCQL